jgi:hypothetical protein
LFLSYCLSLSPATCNRHFILPQWEPILKMLNVQGTTASMSFLNTFFYTHTHTHTHTQPCQVLRHTVFWFVGMVKTYCTSY